jgi:hypothetical protein
VTRENWDAISRDVFPRCIACRLSHCLSILPVIGTQPDFCFDTLCPLCLSLTPEAACTYHEFGNDRRLDYEPLFNKCIK